MKNKMYKYFTSNQTRTYVDLLPEMVENIIIQNIVL